MNLDCNVKPPKQSQHQRLVSAAAPNKQLVDSRSLPLTLFTCFLRIIKAILSRFKQAHLAFPPAAEQPYIRMRDITLFFPLHTVLFVRRHFGNKIFREKITKIMITVRISRDRKPKYPVRCLHSSEGHLHGKTVHTLRKCTTIAGVRSSEGPLKAGTTVHNIAGKV